jgi:hypothetical protein
MGFLPDGAASQPGGKWPRLIQSGAKLLGYRQGSAAYADRDQVSTIVFSIPTQLLAISSHTGSACHHSASSARIIAGLFELLILSQSRDGPDR